MIYLNDFSQSTQNILANVAFHVLLIAFGQNEFHL